MGKLVLILTLLLGACSNQSYHIITGHSQQSDVIESAFQNALEYNQDGVSTVWYDETTGKSGTVMPLYASYDWSGPCRYFQIAYFYPDKNPTYHNGQACRRNSQWKIY